MTVLYHLTGRDRGYGEEGLMRGVGKCAVDWDDWLCLMDAMMHWTDE